MTPLAWGIVAVAVGAAVTDWTAVWIAGPPGLRVERIAKPATIGALLALAVVLPPTAHPGVRPVLVAALAASLVGDVLLLSPGRLVGGLAAVLVAHVAYLLAFLQLPGSDWGTVAGTFVAFGVVAVVGRDIVQAAGRSGMRAPVAAYVLMICAMAMAATRTLLPAAAVGGWLFVASDATLGWDRFVAAAPRSAREAAVRRLAVIATYHAAQALLVLALAT